MIMVMKVGVILGDVPGRVSPREHLDALLRQVEAAQRNGVSYLTIGQHYLYGDLRWLQPIPTLARLAGELDEHVKLATTIVQVPLYHPVALAEELATLDIMTAGRLVIGAGAGYRPDEFAAFGIDFGQRFAMFSESLSLMKQLWTSDSVTFHGKYWSLEDARPHIQPWQTPHPPLWIGAMSETGVRRAARLGDAWVVTPETKLPDLVRLLRVYEAERDRLGLPVSVHPLRHEIVPGASLDDALERFERMAKTRLIAYARRSLATRDAGALAADFRALAEKEAFLGTPAECVAQVAALAAVAPIDPIIVRAQWPDMTSDDVVSYLDQLGEHIIPALREITPVATTSGK
jgi:alkanesulfonate monooxygenase SsuD/methylene tetrahydromethanopterin reductase-like flavin-dependent oxidoreductase (luciferase family)